MKKSFLLICSLVPLFVWAQQHKFIGGALFNLNGIGLLGNSGQFWNSPHEKEGAGHGGISYGLFVKREFAKKIYGVLELRYSTKGSIYEFNSQYGTRTSESLNINYIELPILIGYKIKPLKRTYYLESGLAFAKLISAKIKAEELYRRKETPGTKDFKSIDLIWIGSFKFPLIKKWQEKFLLGLSVSRSIISIHKYYKIYNLEYGIEFNYMFN